MTGQMSQLVNLSGSRRAEGDGAALKGASACQHSNQLPRHVRLRTGLLRGESALSHERARAEAPRAARNRPVWRSHPSPFFPARSRRHLWSADKMPFLLPSSLPRSLVFLSALVTLCSGEELQTSNTGSTCFQLGFQL